MTTLTTDVETRLRAAVRDVADFPRPGIVFKDITPVLGSPELFALTIQAMAAPWHGAGITHVVAVESRGFLFGGPLALALGAGLVPVRKPGKLPHATGAVEYDLEYGTDRLEIHLDACGQDARVLVVDDVLATGGTAAAARTLVERTGATVAGFAFLMALDFLGGEARLGGVPMSALVRY
jgi:adenine phosphoribosyltransferase